MKDLDLDLDRPRTLGELVRTTIRIYRSRPGLVFAVALVVVAPIEIVILGLGDQQLWRSYSTGGWLGTESDLAGAMDVAASFLVPVTVAVVLASTLATLGLLLLVLPGIWLGCGGRSSLRWSWSKE